MCCNVVLTLKVWEESKEGDSINPNTSSVLNDVPKRTAVCLHPRMRSRCDDGSRPSLAGELWWWMFWGENKELHRASHTANSSHKLTYKHVHDCPCIQLKHLHFVASVKKSIEFGKHLEHGPRVQQHLFLDVGLCTESCWLLASCKNQSAAFT